MSTPDTITIGSTAFDVYMARLDADEYLGADYNRATGWAALANAAKDQAIVTATRRFNRLPWDGTPTDVATPQPLAWPRTGMAANDGVAVGTTDFPDMLLIAFASYAYDLTATATLDSSLNSGSNQKRLKAGSVELEFFNPTTQTAGILAPDLMELVGIWFAGADAGNGSAAYGTDAETDFENLDAYGRTGGYY